MFLKQATEADYPEIVALANLAYRATGAAAGWNTEARFLEGPRLTEPLLREDLAAKPTAHLLIYREIRELQEAASDQVHVPILGTVWLEPESQATWYLGLLTIRPDLQNRRLGRTLLAAAEDYARQHSAARIRMTVLHVRDTLIAWYQRRGYTLTGETHPFPADHLRFGRPLRGDLHFVILEKAI